ncbi:hypothetical protein C8F04DRAFT_1276526 [Mycena alexandri]|uniref:Uncharacterized protein n=1 Tax=Mycena alexandri TaxID=1745969 RepID=A0AAD6S0Y8_9AGAR|nr:hypothetical protein C8F04DRAFT_1276526 [Mycena alexandri]
MAEDGVFSLDMLAECVILIRNLARMYPVEFSRQLLWSLYAYVYFSQNPPTAGHSMDKLRIFLEPNSDRPPPEMDKSTTMVYLHKFHGDGSIIQDAVRASYNYPWQTHTIILSSDAFTTHFEDAIVVLREVVTSSTSKLSFDFEAGKWILFSTLKLLPTLPSRNRLSVLTVLTETVEYLSAIMVDLHSADYGALSDFIVNTLSDQLFIFGLLNEALTVSDCKIRYLSSSRRPVVSDLRDALFERAFLLCDMGRFAEAVQFTETNMPIPSQYVPVQNSDIFLCCGIHIRIMQRTWENSKALYSVWRAYTAARDHHRAEYPKIYNLHLQFLSVEFVAVWGHVGRTDKALMDAEKAVSFNRQEVSEDFLDAQQCVLVHSLTTLSNCLAAVGRYEEAVVASQEAVSLKQELGANTFHSLSLRLATCGELNGALLNAETATELFRDLVALAPRHFPALARSLQNMASILWNFDRQDESIAACAEAVSILRKVVDAESYFLPALAEALDQLVTYCKVNGDVGGASAAAAECAEVLKQSASLPCQPEFLLDEAEIESDGEDDEAGWETVSEGPDEDLADTSLEVKTVISENAREIILRSELTVQTDASKPSLQEAQMTRSLPHEVPKSSFATLDEGDTPVTEATSQVSAKSRLRNILTIVTPLQTRVQRRPSHTRLSELHVAFAYTSPPPALLLDAPRRTFFHPPSLSDMPTECRFDVMKKLVAREANADFVAFLTTACPLLKRIESKADFCREDLPRSPFVYEVVRDTLVSVRLPRTTSWPGVTNGDSIPVAEDLGQTGTDASLLKAAAGRAPFRRDDSNRIGADGAHPTNPRPKIPSISSGTTSQVPLKKRKIPV